MGWSGLWAAPKARIQKANLLILAFLGPILSTSKGGMVVYCAVRSPGHSPTGSGQEFSKGRL